MRAGTLIFPYNPHETFPISSRPTYCALCRCQPSRQRPPYPRPGVKRAAFATDFRPVLAVFRRVFSCVGVFSGSPLLSPRTPRRGWISHVKNPGPLSVSGSGVALRPPPGGLLTGQAHRCRPMRTRLPLRSLALGVCSIRSRASTAVRLGCAVCVFSALIVSRFRNFFNAFVLLSF